MSVKQMKKQLAIAALSVVMAAVALGSATYAWFVSNTKVDGTTSTVSAQANGMVLQIASGPNAIHDGSDHQTTAASRGHEISPSSTNDALNWYVPKSWNGTDVSGYQKTTISKQLEGAYALEGDSETYYAYTMAEYTLYTINQTGEADVYLDNSSSNGPVVVTASEGASQEWFDKIRRAQGWPQICWRASRLDDDSLRPSRFARLRQLASQDQAQQYSADLLRPRSLNRQIRPAH